MCTDCRFTMEIQIQTEHHITSGSLQFAHAQSIVCEEKKSKRKKLYFFFVGNASERIHPESIILAPEAAL